VTGVQTCALPIFVRKATLVEKSLVADSPDSLKVFTREELIEIVSGGRGG
jgi:hypothetical protein